MQNGKEKNNSLRKKIYDLLSEKKDKVEAGKIIFEKIISCPQYINAKKVLCYFSSENEVDTKKIIEDAIERKKQVGLPVTSDTIKFLSVDKNTVFKTGKFGIKEPIFGDEISGVDLIIVPMVAFDKKCNRLGHGKGYYDRFLEKEKSFKLGLAFCEQEGEFITFPHDIPMDMIITDKDIFYKEQ